MSEGTTTTSGQRFLFDDLAGISGIGAGLAMWSGGSNSVGLSLTASRHQASPCSAKNSTHVERSYAGGLASSSDLTPIGESFSRICFLLFLARGIVRKATRLDFLRQGCG